MNSLDLNKTLAALLSAGIIAMVTGIIADVVVHPKPLHESAYKPAGVAAPAATAPAQPAAPSVAPVGPMLAAANAEAGGQLARRLCAACHTFGKGEANRVGPNNYGVVGAPVGHAEGFNYSPALHAAHEAGKTWGYEELNAFLANPRAALPGNRMAFGGIRSAQDRANVIAWLRQQADSPKPLP